MLVVRFDVPQKTVAARQTLKVRVEEVGGAINEIAEQGKK
jgi:hypothetical protein